MGSDVRVPGRGPARDEPSPHQSARWRSGQVGTEAGPTECAAAWREGGEASTRRPQRRRSGPYQARTTRLGTSAEDGFEAVRCTHRPQSCQRLWKKRTTSARGVTGRLALASKHTTAWTAICYCTRYAGEWVHARQRGGRKEEVRMTTRLQISTRRRPKATHKPVTSQ